MFCAAITTRRWLVPQSGHSRQRTDKPFVTLTPQPEQTWLVNAGLIAITERPAHAAV
jgi:hypothetical protein